MIGIEIWNMKIDKMKKKLGFYGIIWCYDFYWRFIEYKINWIVFIVNLEMLCDLINWVNVC